LRGRIRKLRKQSLGSKPQISPERAILLTQFYANNASNQASTPVARALAFRYLLVNKKICINSGELIVGERGPSPKATPTYPEICCHSLEDLAILDARKKMPYAVDDATRKAYKETIIPFWRGRSIRDAIFSQMSDEWKAAYEAGVFTEFLEQRAPGHTVLGDKIYKKGLLDLKEEIKRNMQNLDSPTDPATCKKMEELKAMEIAAEIGRAHV
jgi:pyruvate-formate lyase